MITETQETVWHTFAQSNSLDFIPGGSSLQLEGNYRSHFVKIQMIALEYQPSTQITLLINILDSQPLISESTPARAISASNIIRLLIPNGLLLNKVKGKIELREGGEQIFYEQSRVEDDLEYLQFLLSLMGVLADNYASIIATGGEIIPILQKMATEKRFKDVAAQLLLNIGKDTTSRLSHRTSTVLCPRCLVRFEARQFSLLRWKSITYYGCRMCGQSRYFFEGQVVAMLDSKMRVERIQRNRKLYINWLRRRDLFDFHEIEIVQASDEDVERFAVQVGNDTDRTRAPYYAQMSCTVSPHCSLSRNTMRILEQMFKRVNKIESL